MYIPQGQYMLYILYDIILSEPSISFPYIMWLVTVTVTMSSDMTDVWPGNIITNPDSSFKNRIKEI